LALPVAGRAAYGQFMTMRDQEEQDWKISVMETDLRLKGKQAFWETPRNLVIIIGGLVAISAAVAGLVGYRAGQSSSAPPTQIIFQPGSIVVPATK
jgi:hypothetical protein